ncbi:MAG: hypothetical protein BZ138_05610 [Methanosphaera sp. rholeuAM270]|nr:MAG: hypothetical protein BZ138_05610 [Methanosphaera sp. rholeuAM270]
MKIGVIVHGPGIIDTGYAKKIIDMLREYGEVSSKLGGTMGRTAVIDAHLEDEIDISEKLLPSQSIQLLSEDNDILFLLNYGKSIITGHAFAYKVLGNVKDKVNLVQIERPGEDDGVIIQWNSYDNTEFLNKLNEKLNLEIMDSMEVKGIVENLTGYEDESGIIKRKVAGVSPGENIMLNGIIIGKVTEDELTIIAEDNMITSMIGGEIKEHGLEKLGKIDLKTAIIKTGLLRKSENIRPRQMEHESGDRLRACFLNHAADDIYKYRKSDILVSVGDDTTLLSSDILYRFNVPIIGITDGDLDKVVLKGFKLEESLIIQVQSGYDDIIGQKIYEEVFNKKDFKEIASKDQFKKEIIKIIDREKIKYKFVDKQLT